MNGATVANAIAEDLRSRAGLDDAWMSIDAVTRETILALWGGLIDGAIKRARQDVVDDLFAQAKQAWKNSDIPGSDALTSAGESLRQRHGL